MIQSHNSIVELDLTEIGEALGGFTRSGTHIRVACPIHGGKDRNLSLWNGNSGKLGAKCHSHECSWKDIVGYIENINGSSFAIKKTTDFRSKDWSRIVSKIWSETKTVCTGDPVHDYLTNIRKLPLEHIPDDIRLHERCRLEENVYYPALVAPFRSITGDITGLQRIFLIPNSQPIKRMISNHDGSTVGSSVRLGLPSKRLVIAEGIVSGLATSLLSDVPAWVAGSAYAMPQIQIPDTVETVIIAVDNETVGMLNSSKLKKRLESEGRKVFCATNRNDGKGGDWADCIARTYGN